MSDATGISEMDQAFLNNAIENVTKQSEQAKFAEANLMSIQRDLMQQTRPEEASSDDDMFVENKEEETLEVVPITSVVAAAPAASVAVGPSANELAMLQMIETLKNQEAKRLAEEAAKKEAKKAKKEAKKAKKEAKKTKKEAAKKLEAALEAALEGKSKEKSVPAANDDSEDDAPLHISDDEDEDEEPAPLIKTTKVQVVVPDVIKSITVGNDKKAVRKTPLEALREEAVVKKGKKRVIEFKSDSDEEEGMHLTDEDEKKSNVALQSPAKKKREFKPEEWIAYTLSKEEFKFLIEHPSFLIREKKSEKTRKGFRRFVCALYTKNNKAVLKKFMPCRGCLINAKAKRVCTNNSDGLFDEKNRVFYVENSTLRVSCEYCHTHELECMYHQDNCKKTAIPKSVAEAIERSHKSYMKKQESKKQEVTSKSESTSVTKKTVDFSELLAPFVAWARASKDHFGDDGTLGMGHFVSYSFQDKNQTATILDLLSNILIEVAPLYPNTLFFKNLKRNVMNIVDLMTNLFWARRSNCAREIIKDIVNSFADFNNGLYKAKGYMHSKYTSDPSCAPGDVFYNWGENRPLATMIKAFDAIKNATDYDAKEPASLIPFMGVFHSLLFWLGRIIVHDYDFDLEESNDTIVSLANVLAFKNTLLAYL